MTRRVTKSSQFGFRINKQLEPVFLRYLNENCLTASEVARDAVEKLLRSNYQDEIPKVQSN